MNDIIFNLYRSKSIQDGLTLDIRERNAIKGFFRFVYESERDRENFYNNNILNGVRGDVFSGKVDAISYCGEGK